MPETTSRKQGSFFDAYEFLMILKLLYPCDEFRPFSDYVNKQKSVREEIARMSSKQMYRVQEEVASLKQLLSLVNNGLQRNAFAIDKLKQESAQVCKYLQN